MIYFYTKGTFRRSTASPGCAKISACFFHICLFCAILSQTVPFQYSSSSSLYRLAGPSRSFLVSLRNVPLVLICDVHRFVVVLMCPARSGVVLSAWDKEGNIPLVCVRKEKRVCREMNELPISTPTVLLIHGYDMHTSTCEERHKL